MKNLKKRNELPSFLRLPYKFNIGKICELLVAAPEGFDGLDNPDKYGKLAESCPCLEEKFGLKFKSIEEAYEHLRRNGVKNDEMKWDYRNFIKRSNGHIILTDNPYKQMSLTEYNPKFDSKKFNVRIPKTRLDERQYNKLKSWVKNTYLEEVLSTFKGFVTRVRISRMEPGCIIDEHIDYNTDYSIRIHIPLKTNSKCGFYINRGKNYKKDYIKMPADGYSWFFNQGYKHSAWNKGDSPRDHLILSVAGQEDLSGLV